MDKFLLGELRRKKKLLNEEIQSHKCLLSCVCVCECCWFDNATKIQDYLLI